MNISNLGNRVVNNYLIPGEDGYILIDTGYPNGFRRFQRKLRKAGVNPGQIRLVFLTHAHDDHAGFLNDVLRMNQDRILLKCYMGDTGLLVSHTFDENGIVAEEVYLIKNGEDTKHIWSSKLLSLLVEMNEYRKRLIGRGENTSGIICCSCTISTSPSTTT